MSETPPQSVASPSLTDVDVKRRRGPSIVWLIPIVAALIGGGVAYRTYANKGPIVRLTMKDGSGMEAGKTKIKYLDIEVGVVQSLDLTDQGRAVLATAEMDPRTKPHLSENTVFWKVSPRVSLSGISGLGTLVSGQYIAMLPADGKEQRDFTLLEGPPLTAEHKNALSIELRSDRLGSISAGSPITYRSIQVGEIEKYDLEDESRAFRIHAMIYAPYAKLVKKSTQFWDASGVDVSIGASGLQVRTASVASLLEGGVAFDTPPWGADAPPVEAGASFELLASQEMAQRARERVEGLNISVESRDGSIALGAPVFYRKYKVGHVGTSELSADATTVRYHVHVDARYATLVRANSRFWNASGVNMHVGVGGLDLRTDSIESILEGGIEFATPNRPGAHAERGTLFALSDAPEEEWLAWAPKIWIGPKGEERAIAHALPAEPLTPRGLAIVLESFELASVKSGDGIYYREIKIGEIGEHELSADSRTVRIHARIEPRYATLVRNNSRFWNASGISAHLGLSGLEVRTESLESIMAGGVGLATPDEPGDPVKPGTIFPLHPEAKDEWKRWSPAILVDGSRVGKPVEHAIHEETHGDLFRRAPKVESVAPDEPGSATTPTEAEASPAGEPPRKRPGFFRRLFGRGDPADE